MGSNKLIKGVNDLATVNPELAKQWHPTKNGDLKPINVVAGSSKKVWWYLPYDDPKTGKHFDFEWETEIRRRVFGFGCPYLSGHAVWSGFNDLATVNPELAKQWHPTKNGNLKPTDVTVNSGKKIWWLLPYDDPKTGKHFDFEWQATISDRNRGECCPYLSGKTVWLGFNDLATVNPELAKQWHPIKNSYLTPEDMLAGSSDKVWWYLPYDDPKTGKHFDFEWQAAINSRNSGVNCPYLVGQAVWPGFNDLATLNPNLAKEWHPTKNGNLKPTDVTSGSSKKVWWFLPYDDPKTGKHFDFEWKDTVSHRNNGRNCPYLSNQTLYPGFNDLATTNPKLAAEWHPTKNKCLKPTDVMAGSGQKAWWLYSYDDPKTGKHFDFEWKAVIGSRNNGMNCPYLSNQAVWPGFNDLATINPALAAEWHPIKNNKITPNNVAANSNKKVWWLLPYDDPETGKHFDFEWQATVNSRNSGKNCPYLTGNKIWPGFNDFASVNPELAKEWHPTKNGKLTPKVITANNNNKFWWLLPYDDPKTGKHFDFEWQATVYDRNKGDKCPFLSNHRVWSNFNDLVTVNPELAKQWHPTKNGNLKPTDVTSNSKQKVWWLLPYDDPITGKHFDFEWKAIVNNRNKGVGCPYLVGQNIWPGFNDLATRNPKLAAEWHPTKNSKLKPTDVTVGTKKKVWWLLSYDDPKTGEHFDYEWEASIANRNNGNGCPYLSTPKTVNLIQTLLQIKNINFVLEKKYSDLKNKYCLPFDFFINNKYIIEVDGMQHFKPVAYFGGKESFKTNIYRDNLKNQYCFDNNIPLLRIPYIYDPVADKDKIEQFVLDFIETGEVPQEIIDFYSKYKFSNYVSCIKSNTLLETA